MDDDTPEGPEVFYVNVTSMLIAHVSLTQWLVALRESMRHGEDRRLNLFKLLNRVLFIGLLLREVVMSL